MSDPAARPELPACPYPGIAPFTFSDREVFFARDDEARRLIRLIVLYRGVLLYSASGAGKSSLVNAKLIPLAIEEGYQPERLRVQPWPGAEIIVEPQPFPSFFGGAEAGKRTVLSTEAFRERLETLREGDGQVRPLLIFDQFEEWVTLFEEPAESAGRECKDRIAAVLTGLIQDARLPVKVLLVLREDYLAHLEPLFARSPSLSDHYVRLTALGREQIGSVIRGPFERHPGAYAAEISPLFAGLLKNELAARAGADGTPPTEVQIVCRSLFEAARKGREPYDVYREQGGVQGLLEHFLERSLAELEPALRGPAVALLTRMITSAGTRNVISRDDLIDRVALEDDLEKPLLGRALDRLEEQTRLVRRELRREVYFYEIVSEFLIPWIRRKAEALRLDRVERANRRLRRVAVGLAAFSLLTLIALGLAAFGLLSWRGGEQKRQLANARLLAQAADREEDSRHAMLVALEAVLRASPTPWWLRGLRALGKGGTDDSEETRTAALAETSLRRALARSEGFPIGGPGRPIVQSIFDRDRRWLAGIGPRGVLQIWRMSGAGLVSPPRTLSGMKGLLEAVAVSQDGRQVAAASGGPMVLYWRAGRSGAPVELPAQEPAVSDLAFSANGLWLIAAGRSDTPEAWDLRSVGSAARSRRLECGQALTVRWALSPRGRRLALGCDDGSVVLWEIDGRPVRTLRTFQVQAEITALAFSQDEATLAAGDRGGGVSLWPLDGKALKPASIVGGEAGSEKEAVTALAFSPDGRRLAVGRGRGAQTLRLAEGGEPSSAPLARQGGGVDCFVWSLGGRWLLGYGPSTEARLWDLRTLGSPSGEELYMISSAAFDPTERWLVTSSQSGVLFRRDLAAPNTRDELVRSPASGEKAVETMSFSDDARWLVSVEEKSAALLWPSPGEKLWRWLEPLAWSAHGGSARALAPQPEGRLISAGEDGVRFWEPRNERRLAGSPLPDSDSAVLGLIQGPAGRRLLTWGEGMAQLWAFRGSRWTPRGAAVTAWEVAASPDRRLAATAGEDRKVLLWNLADDSAGPRDLQVQLEAAAGKMALGPDAAWLLTASGNTPRLWRPPGGRSIALRRHKEGLAAAEFSADGRWLLTADRAGMARVWDLRDVQAMAEKGLNPQPAQSFDCGSPILGAAISPDSRLVAIATREKISLRLLGEPETHVVSSVLVSSWLSERERSGVGILRFSPDNRWLAMAGDAGVALWDLTARSLADSSVELPAQNIPQDLAFDPSGRWLFLATDDGTIRRWRLHRDELPDLACRAAGRNLTQEEWKQILPGEIYRQTCPDLPLP